MKINSDGLTAMKHLPGALDQNEHGRLIRCDPSKAYTSYTVAQ